MDPKELTREQLIEELADLREAYRDLEARCRASERAEHLRHELEVHQIELEAQNQALREAQDAQEASRSRYADLYDFAPIGYCTLDKKGVVLEINLTGAALLGRERSRIFGLPLRTQVRLDDPEALMRHIRRCIAGNGRVADEIGLSIGERSFVFRLISAPVQDRRGEVTACRTAFLDITRERMAEADLERAHAAERATGARLQAVDQATLAVQEALANLSEDDIQDELRDFLKIVVEAARGMVGAELAAIGVGNEEGCPFEPWIQSGIPPDIEAAIGRTPRQIGVLNVAVRANRPTRLRDVAKHPSFQGLPPHHPLITSFLGVSIHFGAKHRGTLYLANKHGAEEFTEDDQIKADMIAARVGIALEIARLRQVEACQRGRLELLAKAGRVLAESIDYDATLDAIVGLVVPELADACAISVLEGKDALRTVIGRLANSSSPDREDVRRAADAARLPEDVRAAIESGTPQVRRLTPEYLGREDHDPRYIELLRELGLISKIVAPLLAGGRTLGVLRLAMASSGRVQTEDDLPLAQEIAHHAALALESARLYRVAQAAARARDEVVAIVSHDLRGPLSVIQMSAEVLLQGDPASERNRRAIDAIKRSVGRMHRLVEDLRDAGMLDSGQLTIKQAAEPVPPLLEEALKVLAPLVERRGLRVDIKIAPDLPPVHCDRDRIVQVLANLLGNAIRFSPERGEIRLSARPEDGGVCFAVEDQGPGISEQDLPKIFERYGRGPGREATGLGLYIARGIVDAHGGRMWVDTKKGEGSTFLFTLPLAPSREG